MTTLQSRSLRCDAVVFGSRAGQPPITGSNDPALEIPHHFCCFVLLFCVFNYIRLLEFLLILDNSSITLNFPPIIFLNGYLPTYSLSLSLVTYDVFKIPFPCEYCYITILHPPGSRASCQVSTPPVDSLPACVPAAPPCIRS